MPSAHELRTELKEMRSSHPDHQPVSRMKKADISGLIERMKFHTETTQSVAMTKREPVKMSSEVEKVVHIKAEPKAKAKAEEKPKTKAKAESAKESVTERMARIRSMRGKKKD